MMVALVVTALLLLVALVLLASVQRDRNAWMAACHTHAEHAQYAQGLLKSAEESATTFRNLLSEERAEYTRFVGGIVAERAAQRRADPNVGLIADPPSVRSADRAAAEEQRARPLAHSRSAVGVSDPTVPPVHRAEEEGA